MGQFQSKATDTDDQVVSLHAKAQKALESPCIQKLRDGPCGSEFSEAFLCFLKSNEEEKGSDCVISFLALKKCILTNPDAFHNKDVLERVEEDKMHEKKPKRDYRFHQRYMVSGTKHRKRNHKENLPNSDFSADSEEAKRVI